MIASPETAQAESRAGLQTGASTPIQSDGAQDAVAENLHLIGRPTLKGFLRFVTRHAVNPPGEGVLIEEWQAAHECVRILEKEGACAASGRWSCDPATSGTAPSGATSWAPSGLVSDSVLIS